VQELEGNKRQVGSDLTYLKNLFNDKVDTKDIRSIEHRIQDLAPWDAVRNVYKEISFYTKRDDFDLFKNDHNYQLRIINEKLELLLAKKEFNKEMVALKDWVKIEFE
jgi:hypothetical protein